MEDNVKNRTSHMKGRVAAICGSLGHLNEGEYLIEPNCLDGIKDLIRLLKVDDPLHTSRRCMGEVNIVQNHLIPIIKNCQSDAIDLFRICLRLLVNLTTPAILLFGEKIPEDKINRHLYLTLIGHDQRHKAAFSDIELWNKICSKLTNLLEVEWVERSADDGLEIERILTLIRNVLQVPADVEDQKRPTDMTIHEKVVMALRESQILELLLLVASNENEEAFYLNLLEIFSHLLREQNPKALGRYEVDKAGEEINKETEDLLRARETKLLGKKKYTNTRNFNSTFVMKGIKSVSNMDVICHKSLESLQSVDLSESQGKTRSRKKKIPRDYENPEIRSNPSVQFFLKEFCLEFLNSGFHHFMNTVKLRIDSGKSLAHDRTYYFWAIMFFMRFSTAANLDVAVVRTFLSVESFHFIQTNMEMAFEHLATEKKETDNWIRRIHTILKAYQSLLETIMWMDSSKQPMIRAESREIKTNVFYVVEYRELTLSLLKQYDPLKFSISYLRDLIETSHLFLKLLEEFTKQTKLVVQKIKRKQKSKTKNKKSKKGGKITEINKKEKWEKIKDDVYDCLTFKISFPEIPPFDATLDIPIDDQRGRAMKNIQKFLHEGRIKDAIGLLRSSRQVWPENDYFGNDEMSPEEESMALEEICLAELEPMNESEKGKTVEEGESEEDEDVNEDAECGGYTKIIEQEFDILDYKQRLVNRKIVEICGILLKNYNKNSDHVNHCAVKLLHRIGWECNMPAMLYQLSLYCTLLMILNDPSQCYNEIKTFAVNLIRKFRKHAAQRPMVFVELVFWKNPGVALEIQHGYEPDVQKPKVRRKKKGRGKRKITKENGEESGKFIQDEGDSDEFSQREENRSRKRFSCSSSSGDEVSLHFDSEDPKSGRVESNMATDNDAVTKLFESARIPVGKHSGMDEKVEDKIEGTSPEETKNVSDVELESVEGDLISGAKRGRNDLKTLSNSSDEFSDIENRLLENRKRPRFISSDSDEETMKSEGEKPAESFQRRPKVIDTDSDSEDMDNKLPIK